MSKVKKIRYWIERDDRIEPHPVLNGFGAEKAPYVRVFTNAHGFAFGALAAVFYGRSQQEAESLAQRFLELFGAE